MDRAESVMNAFVTCSGLQLYTGMIQEGAGKDAKVGGGAVWSDLSESFVRTPTLHVHGIRHG